MDEITLDILRRALNCAVQQDEITDSEADHVWGQVAD